MMLIITEKPTVAKEIAKALGGFKVDKDHLSNGKDIRITWAIGHLVQYDAEKTNNIDQLPMIPKEDEWQIKTIDKSREDQFKIVKRLLNESSTDLVVNACDAEREGELIFRLIVRASGAERKPQKRMWIQSMSKDGLIKAFNNLRPSKEFEGLGLSAEGRAKADWLVGLNASIAMGHIGERKWDLSQSASVGRVKTPTLAIIVNRYLEVTNFIPKDFWEIHGTFSNSNGEYIGRWIDVKKWEEGQKEKPADPNATAKQDDDSSSTSINGLSRFDTKESMQVVLDRITIDGQLKDVAQVLDYAETKETYSPALYSLLQIQVRASNAFKFSPDHTLSVVQSLYEKHKCVTYPRTDSSHLPEDYPKECKGILAELAKSSNESLKAFTDEALAGVDTANKRVFNNKKVSDHFAIIPTINVPNLGDLSADEKKLYDLIVKRFKAVFLPPKITNTTQRFTYIGTDDAFRTTGSVVKSKGWTEIEKGSDDDAKDNLPVIGDASEVHGDSYEVQEKQTQPPKIHTEATLLLAMENAGRTLEDKEYREALKGKGIGTPATRANIIKELLSDTTGNGNKKQPMMIKEKSGSLIPSDYGLRIVELLRENGVEELISPKFTGEWEERLGHVREDASLSDSFMEYTEKTVRVITEKLKTVYKATPAPTFDEPCRKCQSKLEIQRFKLLCTNDECKWTMPRVVSNYNFTMAELSSIIRLGKSTETFRFKKQDGSVFDSGVEFNTEHKLVYSKTPVVERSEKCPCCKGDMVESKSYIKCINEETNFKDAEGKEAKCGFIIWKTVNKKVLTDTQAKVLIEGGKTELIKGFVSSKGTKFDAFLTVNKDRRISFEFLNNREGVKTEHRCLKAGCDGYYYEKGPLFICEKDKDKSKDDTPECGSRIFKKTYDKEIPPTKLKQLLQGKEITMVGTRKNNDGKPQTMNLKVDKESGLVKTQWVNPTTPSKASKES